MVSRDRANVYEPLVALASTTTPGNANSVVAGSHRYLLGIVQLTGAGDVAWTVEDSADDSSFATVGLAAVTVVAVNAHVFIIDRQAFRKFVRLVSAAGVGTPTISATYMTVDNLETTNVAGTNRTLVNIQTPGVQ